MTEPTRPTLEIKDHVRLSEWNASPPPHVGWWQANSTCSPSIWRWWNGERWSGAVPDVASAETAGRVAAYLAPVGVNDLICWTDYWPENARVPRIAPPGSESMDTPASE